jgi:hypothetical protein
VRSSAAVGVVRAIIGFTGKDCPGAGFRSATFPQPERSAIAAIETARESLIRPD